MVKFMLENHIISHCMNKTKGYKTAGGFIWEHNIIN